MLKKILSSLLSVLILFSIVSTRPVVTVYAQEDVGGGNLGFESNFDEWKVNGNVTIQATGGKSGNYALMKSGSSLSKTVKGIPQGSYTVSMWVKGATSSNSAKVTMKDTGGPDSVLKVDTFLDASTWRQIAHRNVLVYNGQMTINIDAGTSSGLQIDEVTITLDSNDNNPVKNWDFEGGLQNWVTKGGVNLDTANADTGVNAVKLADHSEVSQKVSVKPNTDYIATVRMKVDQQDTYKTTKQYDLTNTSVLGLLVERVTLGNRVNLGVRGLDGVVLRQAPASTEGYALVTIAFHTGVNQTEVELYANTIFDQNYINSVTVHENKDTDHPFPNGWQRPKYDEMDNTHPADGWTSNGSQFAYVDNLNVFEVSNDYIKGADMTFLQAMEDAGGKYFANGVQQDALRILSNHGVNSILTTLWVKAGNPVYDWITLTPLKTATTGYDGETVTGRQTIPGYFDKKHSVAIGKRANELNMTYTPSFHYSDTWISAAKAHIPYEWIEKDYNGKLSNPDIQMLETAVYNYVHDTLSEMKSQGVNVISVKNGNEQDGGLLFPVAMGSNYTQHAAIITASSRAVKEIYPSAINTIHTNTGYDPAQISGFFQAFANRGAEYDGMAFSLYGGREVTGQFGMMNTAMQNSATKYYDYINVETGFSFTTSSQIVDTESTLGLSQYYSASPNGQYNYLLDYMQAPLDLPNPYGTTRGFYYWNTESLAIYGAGAKAGEGPGPSKRGMFNNGAESIKEMGSTQVGKSGDMMDSMYAYLIRGHVKKSSDTVYSPLRYNGVNYDVGEATSLTFMNNNLTLSVGKVSRLQPTIAPMDKLLTDYKIRYSSNNPSVAEVSNAGLVTGRSAGTAVITATIGTVTTTVNVTVTDTVATSGISITYDIIRAGISVGSGTITPGSTINAKPFDKMKFKSAVSGTPTNKAVVYTVSDPKIAWWYGDTWQTDDKTIRTLSDKLSTANYEPVVQLNPIKGGTAAITVASADGASSVNFNVAVTQTNVTGISINGGNRSVLAGKSLQLTAAITPSDASFYKVNWSSDNESIAKVDSTGWITAIKPGSTTIRVISDSNPAITASITLTVTDVLVEKLLLSSSKIGLPVGSSKALVYLALPDNAVNKAAIWSIKSGDEGTITVNQNGVVTGLKTGTGTVFVTSADGSHVTAECIVQVVEGSIASTSMKLSKNEVWVKSNYFSPDSTVKGDSKPANKLEAIFTPEEATNTGVIWSSNNDAVASVDANGIITAHKTGVAVITATSIDGGFTDKATIYVPQISEDWENYSLGTKGGFTDGNTFTYQVVDASGNKKLQASVASKAGSSTSLSRRTFTPVSDDLVVVDFDWNVGSFTADNRYRGGHISIEDTNGNTYLALATYPAPTAGANSGIYPEMTYYYNKTYNSTAFPAKNGTVNGDFNYIHGGFTGTSGTVGSYADTKDVGIGFKGANKDYNVRVNLDFKNKKISFTVTDKSSPSITSTVTNLAMDPRISYSNGFGAIAFSHYFNSVASWTTAIDNLSVYPTTIQPEKIEYKVDAINVNASQGIKLVPVKDALSSTAKINARVTPTDANQNMVFTPLGDLVGVVTVDANGNITVNPAALVNYGNYEAIQSVSGYVRVSSVSTPSVYTDVQVTVGSPNASEILQVYVDGKEYLLPVTLAANATSKLTFAASGGDGVSDIYAYNWKVTYGNAQIDANGRLSASAPGKVIVTFTIDVFRKQEVRTLEFNIKDLTTHQVTYDINGGSGAMPVEIAKAAGDTFAAAEVAGVTAPQGKRFKEWNTNRDGNGTAYTAGAEVTMPADNLTLYAIWEAVSVIGLPSVPQNVSVTAASASSIVVGWNPAKDAVSYNVYRSDSENGTYTKRNASLVTTAAYTDNGLSASTTYYYKVLAVNAAGESAQSAAVSATTSAAPPVNTTAYSLTGPSAVNVDQSFQLTYGLSNVTESVYAKSVTVNYDPAVLEFVDMSSLLNGFMVVGSTTAPGSVKIVEANTGSTSPVTGTLDLLALTFKALAPSVSTNVYMTGIVLGDQFGNEVTVASGSGTGHWLTVAITVHVNKSTLASMVADVNSVVAGAKVLNAASPRYGYYPQSAIDAIKAALTAANTVLALDSATQVQVDAAAATLTQALTLFRATASQSAGVGDLAIIAANYHANSSHANWQVLRLYDLNNDGKLDLYDLVSMAQRILN
ncbi:glycosyl hydrolase 53 family protein [Paenibacillus whitsoniae]|nr:glycosyl hydrolase 53 family protein [Paenibacillus whitsoniae]